MKNIKYYAVLLVSFLLFINCWTNNLADDLAGNSARQLNLQTALNGANEAQIDQLINGYRVFANRAELRCDVPVLYKMAELMDDGVFMERLPALNGGSKQQTLYAMADAFKNGCASCGSSPASMKMMVEHLDDVKHFVKTFGEGPVVTEGYLEVFKALKNPNYWVQDGTSHMMAYLKGLDKTQVNSLEGAAIDDVVINALSDMDDLNDLSRLDNIDLCTNCLFDIRLVDGTKVELKSYASSTIALMKNHAKFINQFKAYLTNAKIRYVFNGKKGIYLDEVKLAFQDIFQKPNFWNDIVQANNGVPAFFTELQIINATQFNAAAANTSHALYDFIFVF